MSYLINENTVQVQPHWSSNWSNRKKTKMAKMRVNQNKSINRGVNSFFTESYVIEWTCCVRQRVEIRIKWNEWMDCFSGGWKVRRQTKIVQGAIEQEHNFSGSGKPDNAKYMLRIHSIPLPPTKEKFLSSKTELFVLQSIQCEWALCLVEYWDDIG